MRNYFLQNLGRGIKYLLIALALFYAVDWAIFEIRQIRGTGIDSVSVEQYLKTPLKGNKDEYDYIGMVDQNCSRTIFPQRIASEWNPPCWWLRGHRTRWQ
jgi:hypothetical protein